MRRIIPETWPSFLRVGNPSDDGVVLRVGDACCCGWYRIECWFGGREQLIGIVEINAYCDGEDVRIGECVEVMRGLSGISQNFEARSLLQ